MSDSLPSTSDFFSNVAHTTTEVAGDVATYVVDRREPIIGVVIGYMVGSLIESLPGGSLLAPLASNALGVGGGIMGHQRMMERRKIEALEDIVLAR